MSGAQAKARARLQACGPRLRSLLASLVAVVTVFFCAGGMYSYLRPQIFVGGEDGELLFIYPHQRHQLLWEVLLVGMLLSVAIVALTFIAVSFPVDDRRRFESAVDRFGPTYAEYWRTPWGWMDNAARVPWNEDQDIMARVVRPIMWTLALLLMMTFWAATVSYKSGYPFSILLPWTLFDWSHFGKM